MKNNTWNEIYKEEGKVWKKTHEDISKVVDVFKKHKVKKILDIGCGAGRHTTYLAGMGFDVYGIDISEEGLKIADKTLKEMNLKADLKTGNIYDKLPYSDEFFDAIVSIQVLHHSTIENIRKLIKEMTRILKKDGLIFITVPKSRKTLYRTTKYKLIAPRTYMPLDGWEKDLPHFYFNKNLIKKEFSRFKIEKIWLDLGSHYCFVGELK